MSARNTHVLLHQEDNILVSCRDLAPGETLRIDHQPVVLAQMIPLGHKIARRPLAKGDEIFKYGAPIGSALADIAIGEHVHLHNMKSDYIPSHTRKAVG